MYQKVSIIGHLGQDPQQRYTAKGDAITTFSVATSRRWTDANGTQQERTVWFRVSCWRTLGEACAKYLSKGKLVFVEGELAEPTPYQTKITGEWRAALDVTASTVKFLSAKEEGVRADAPDTPQQDGDEPIPF